VKRFHPLRALGLASFLGVAAAAASPVVIPLIPGLTLIHAVSERQGDYGNPPTRELIVFSRSIYEP
jgi:uncharacterized membrane protein YjjP (DUF1212 family)